MSNLVVSAFPTHKLNMDNFTTLSRFLQLKIYWSRKLLKQQLSELATSCFFSALSTIHVAFIVVKSCVLWYVCVVHMNLVIEYLKIYRKLSGRTVGGYGINTNHTPHSQTQLNKVCSVGWQRLVLEVGHGL